MLETRLEGFGVAVSFGGGVQKKAKAKKGKGERTHARRS